MERTKSLASYVIEFSPVETKPYSKESESQIKNAIIWIVPCVLFVIGGYIMTISFFTEHRNLFLWWFLYLYLGLVLFSILFADREALGALSALIFIIYLILFEGSILPVLLQSSVDLPVSDWEDISRFLAFSIASTIITIITRVVLERDRNE